MKQIFYAIALLLVFTACKTTKDYVSRSSEDRTLFDIVKTLNKHSNDEDAAKALPLVYAQVQQHHLKKINTYKNYREITRWDKIIEEYSALQKMYDAISNSGTAGNLVTAVSYQNYLYDAKQQAAEDYYQLAATLLQSDTREDAKKAYTYFKKLDKYVAGYKNARAKMDEAYEAAVINVVINPVQYNLFFFNTGWGNTGYNYSNEYFQQTLVRELGGPSSNRYPARFYTHWEARRENVQPNWVVDLTLRNMDIPYPTTYNSTRNVSKQIEAGRDTSGKIIYQTVYATLNTSRQSFTARGEMEVNITDASSRKNISYNIYRDDYTWQQQYATYTGDSRALSNSDWALVNNNRNNPQPRKEEVLNELYRKIYPQVKNRIGYEVDW
jgi:hypothetical protein